MSDDIVNRKQFCEHSFCSSGICHSAVFCGDHLVCEEVTDMHCGMCLPWMTVFVSGQCDLYALAPAFFG